MNSIQATTTPILLSSDNGVTWKTLICLKSYNIPIQRTTNETDTFCGKAVGLGALSFNPQGNAVVDKSPLSTELTLSQMLTWLTAETILLFKTEFPGSNGSDGSLGEDFYISGSCYVTQVDVQFSTNDVINFNFTLTGFGTLDVTA